MKTLPASGTVLPASIGPVPSAQQLTENSPWQRTCISPDRTHKEDNMSAAPRYADWKQLAEAASTETDPQRLIQLIEQLTQALDESRKPQAQLRPHTV
jgi:hypothetical protein